MINRIFDLLIIADEPRQIEAVRARLGELCLSYRCHFTSSGEQAFDFLDGKPPFQGMPRPNLILLSLHLPGSGAEDVLRSLKSNPSFWSIPLIVVATPSPLVDLLPSLPSAEHLQAPAGSDNPRDLERSLTLLEEIDHFWGCALKLQD